MASIFNNKKSSYAVEILVEKKRHRFYGFLKRSDAEKFKEKLEQLHAYKKGGLEIPGPLLTWLNKLWEHSESKHHYRKLAEIGLAEIRVECGTVGELITRYIPYAINGQDPKYRMVTNRRTACNSFLYFLANQPMGNFYRDERALRVASTIQVKEITVDVAEKFYAELKKTYQPSTWGRRIKHVKTMFGQAVEMGWITKNPFEKCRGTARANRTRDHFVEPEEAQQVLDACPNTRLKLVFSFGRWGGLRIPSEIAFMRWGDVDWDGGKIKICVPKKTTKIDQENGNFNIRYIPLFPEIRKALEEYKADLPQNGGLTGRNDLIFPGMEDTLRAGALLRKQLRQVLKRAGVEEWPKLFMSLRATRDTELQRIYPGFIVCAWIGHSMAVSEQYYLQVPEETYRQASEKPKKRP